MNKKFSPQRKTTLKWDKNGELSEIDMLRIIDKLSSYELNQCELTCDSDGGQILKVSNCFFRYKKIELNKFICFNPIG